MAVARIRGRRAQPRIVLAGLIGGSVEACGTIAPELEGSKGCAPRPNATCANITGPPPFGLISAAIASHNGADASSPIPRQRDVERALQQRDATSLSSASYAPTCRGRSKWSAAQRARAPIAPAAMGARPRCAALHFDRPRQVAAYDALLREVASRC